LWFVSSDRPPGYVRLGGPPGARRTARLLRPGARFIFTTWEFAATPAGWPAQLNQHRDLLSEAGLALRAARRHRTGGGVSWRYTTASSPRSRACGQNSARMRLHR